MIVALSVAEDFPRGVFSPGRFITQVLFNPVLLIKLIDPFPRRVRRVVDRVAGLSGHITRRVDPLFYLVFQIEALVQVLRGATRHVAQLIKYAVTHKNPSTERPFCLCDDSLRQRGRESSQPYAVKCNRMQTADEQRGKPHSGDLAKVSSN